MIAGRKFHLLKTSPFFVAGVLLLAGCGHSASQDSTSAASKDQSNESPVRYVKVVEQTIPETLDLAAKVQADPTRVVRIFPPASGRVVAIEVKPGDRVRRGQPVAILISSDVASAQSDFTKANIEAGSPCHAAPEGAL